MFALRQSQCIFRLLLLSLVMNCPAIAVSQSGSYPSSPMIDLLRVSLMRIEMEDFQRECRAWKERERRNVPTHNARLNGAVVSFHGHITRDNHHLTNNCSLCRRYLREIKTFSKKIEQAMK